MMKTVHEEAAVIGADPLDYYEVRIAEAHENEDAVRLARIQCNLLVDVLRYLRRASQPQGYVERTKR
jgi:hypothetical protein